MGANDPPEMDDVGMKATLDAPCELLKSTGYVSTDQYCSRYIVGTRGKGDVTTGTNHLGFRCVMTPAQRSARH
ncbi:MAG TPA: hypothetical protein VF783_20625 [Terriglobales bacterium]